MPDEKPELTVEQKIQLTRDLALTDLGIRLTALERILLEKEVITTSDYGKKLEEVLNEMHKKMEEQGFPSIASLFAVNIGKK